nr:centriolar coiled-coil protein of 110 kDa-like [Nerophis lumbriciformis]
MWMESYEKFCVRSVATLQEEGKFKKTTCEPTVKYSSVILYCGKAVLSPLLNAEQRQQMCDLRRRAVQLETERRNQQRNKPSAQVRDIPTNCTVQSQERTGSGPVPLDNEIKVSSKPTYSRFGLQTTDQQTTPILNGLIGGNGAEVETEEKSDEEDISMDSLLKQTKEDIRRESSKDGIKVVIPKLSPELISEKDIPSPKSGVEFGFSLHRSPVGPSKIPFPQNLDLTQPKQSISHSIPDQNIRYQTPESRLSPQVQKRKPRPFSTGNIHIVFPGIPGEGAGPSDWEEALSGAARSPDRSNSVSSNGLGLLNRRGSHQSGHSGISPMQETHSPVSPSLPSPLGQHDCLSSTFRRRCHTMDSHLHTDQSDNIDRSQERTPRFMAGVTMRPSSWRNSSTSSNKKLENPSPYLQRPHIPPEVSLRMEPDDPRGSPNETSTASLRHVLELHSNNIEETQRRAQVLEDMQRRLQEEHALQMSLLLAEQEKEQQRLLMELEETERILREQENAKLQNLDTCQWKRMPVNKGLPVVSPSASKPGQSIVFSFPSPVSPNMTSPSPQSPIYLRGPTWAPPKPQARPNQVLKTEQQMALCRIGAIARGFLVRRLLKTHKVQHLRQTIMDTQEFISSFQTEGPQKKTTFSAQDLSLQDRVRAQLRAALYDIYEIFFEIPLEDRLGLLQQDRELCAEKRQRDMEKAKKEKERVVSAATLRSLDRKKREGESPGQARKVMQKPKSPTPIRVQKSSQVQKCVPSQLNRQGSWYKKTPEARVKRTDNLKNLKKQHSLG